MAIVSSTNVVDGPQVDGRCYVMEDHVDNVGKHYIVNYLADIAADYATIMANRAAAITAQLIATEIEQALQVDANPTLVYAAKTDFVPVLRAAYQRSVQAECARLANWILNRIAQGWVTDAQVQTAFGLTSGQWTTLKAQMTSWQADYVAVQAAAGQ